MDLTIRPIVKKSLIGLVLTASIVWLGLWLYVIGPYHYLRAKLSLINADIQTTEFWQVSDSSIYCGRTKNGGWVWVGDVIYQGIIAEDGCIENMPLKK